MGSALRMRAAIALLASALAGPLTAAEPAKDHPLVGRYDGAVLEGARTGAYDEVGLIRGPLQNWGGARPDLLQAEGKVSLYFYKLPAGRSLLEVQRNYEASLQAKGFEVVFSCGTSNSTCYQPRPGSVATTAPYDFALALDEPEWPRLGKNGDYVRNYFGVSGRYVLARRIGPGGVVYASIALAEHKPEVGSFAFVRVVRARRWKPTRSCSSTPPRCRRAWPRPAA